MRQRRCPILQTAGLRPDSEAAELVAPTCGSIVWLSRQRSAAPMLKPTVAPTAGTSTMQAKPIPSTTRLTVSSD